MFSIPKISRAEKQRRAELEKKKAAELEKLEKKKDDIRGWFKSARDSSYTQWKIYETKSLLNPNSSGLVTLLKQPRFHNIKHILVLGLGDPGRVIGDRWVQSPKQTLFFSRLAVIKLLSTILFPSGGRVEVENANLEFSEETVMGLNHLGITVVNGKDGGFSHAKDYSLVYDVRRKQGDIVKHMNSRLQLPAAVLTDVPSLGPSSDDGKTKENVFSRVRQKYDLVSLMGPFHHVSRANEKDLTEANIYFVWANCVAEITEKESQLTIEAYTAAHKRRKMAKTYTAKQEMILLCRKDLPFFDKMNYPKADSFPRALYHEYSQVKLATYDFHGEAFAGSSSSAQTRVICSEIGEL